MNRGLALARAGRLVEARSAYDRAVEADGSNRDALANRGLVALELDDAPAALADLKRAVALGRRDVVLQAALGDAMGRAGLAADAGRLLDHLVARHPDAVSPRIARGTLRLTTDPAAAEADFRRALAREPRQPAAFLGLARLRRASDPAEALRFAVLALEADPRRIDAVELSSRLRGQLGDPRRDPRRRPSGRPRDAEPAPQRCLRPGPLRRAPPRPSADRPGDRLPPPGDPGRARAGEDQGRPRPRRPPLPTGIPQSLPGRGRRRPAAIRLSATGRAHFADFGRALAAFGFPLAFGFFSGSAFVASFRAALASSVLATNCWPAFDPLCFLALVAFCCAGVSSSQASAGR